MPDVKSLQEVLISELGNRAIDSTPIPATVEKNLSPAFPLRAYQEKAFRLFINFWEESFPGKVKDNPQLLFHMATGSGKTLIMAGLILYLFEKGYRDFLFFVNSTNVIDKTRDNFLNPGSKKYLFAQILRLAEKQIQIREVRNFQGSNPDSINICFFTIQGLHYSLQNPSEDGLSYDDFDGKRTVLISDEAHHINVDTKGGREEASKDELFEALTWESTVAKIVKANPRNILLEFTATIDFADENLAAKYRPRLIFDYTLRDFRRDGYSKEVKVVQADLSPFDRAIRAVLLSQYRRKIFERHRLHIKPVLLFKSKTIEESRQFQVAFKEGIRRLSPESLQKIRDSATDDVIASAFSYFAKTNISLENLVAELKLDFSDEKLLSVNSREESELKQLAVNSLEDPRNEYRAVFAVDKLNEGWDVLNLFDIVRLYDTRDSKGGKIGKTTMSEAQLIGRGARYCPFKVSEDQPLYGRKYDKDLANEMRVCEELFYHSAYNPKYIQELNSALEEIGIKAKETRQRRLQIKESFKNTTVYKTGLVFLNEPKKRNRGDIDGLDSTVIEQRHKISLQTGLVRSSLVFENHGQIEDVIERTRKDYDLIDFGRPVIRKALRTIDFFRFENLRKYLPNLKSIDEFITSEKYLGKIKLEISGLDHQVENLNREEMLETARQVLGLVADTLAAENSEYCGSTEFKPTLIKDRFIDKTLNFMLDGGEDREFGRSMRDAGETQYPLDLDSKAWYVFDDCYGTSEEKELVLFIDKHYKALSRKYSEVYLFRNEKHFQLFNFADGRPLEPDFLLYLTQKKNKESYHYQIFIEPKGDHLLKSDEWKEKFLTTIKKDARIEQLFAGQEFTVWGLPFFNRSNRMAQFEKAFNVFAPAEKSKMTTGGNGSASSRA